MLAQHERPTSPLHAVTELASSPPAARITRPDTVKAGLTPKRPRRQVENDEYSAFVRRILRACSRRVGNGDVEALALMLGLAEEIDTAIAEAVTGLRSCGYSWAEIGSVSASPARQLSNAGVQLDPATWPDRPTSACPVRARSGSQSGVLAVTRGHLRMPADLRTDRSGHRRSRPPKQSVISSAPSETMKP
jgi:hypothetical protein